MKYSYYLKLETASKAQLARANQRFFLIREIIAFAGSMAIALTVADATPWPIWDDRPIARLVFVLGWSLAMAWWQLTRIRQAPDAGA